MAVEGYTGRDALIVMRLDLTDVLQELDGDIAELDETLEFSGIAEHLLEDTTLTSFPAIKRWLETVGNRHELERDREELVTERDDVRRALDHIGERLR
jgi:hypothetical protein